jgi:segregation and condensation protein B
MGVKPEYSHLINKLATGQSEFSKAEQETLAIIAYKQPIKQSVIIKIRGNKAYDHIKRFSELGLIKRKKTGHTNELSLEDDFYDYFNVPEGGNPEITEKEIDEKIGERAMEGKNVEEMIMEEKMKEEKEEGE